MRIVFSPPIVPSTSGQPARRSPGDRLRAAGDSLAARSALPRHRPTEELRQHVLVQRRVAVPSAQRSRRSVAGALRRRDAREPQLAQVARERRLRDVPAASSSRLPQLLLAADRLSRDELEDRRVSLLACSLRCFSPSDERETIARSRCGSGKRRASRRSRRRWPSPRRLTSGSDAIICIRRA